MSALRAACCTPTITAELADAPAPLIAPVETARLTAAADVRQQIVYVATTLVVRSRHGEHRVRVWHELATLDAN